MITLNGDPSLFSICPSSQDKESSLWGTEGAEQARHLQMILPLGIRGHVALLV